MVPRIRRLASPAGLILAGLCLLLPFLTASCAGSGQPAQQWRVTYTGADVVGGGRPAIAYTDDADRRPLHTLDEAETKELVGTSAPSLPRQPMAWLAVALMAAALAAAAVRSRLWRSALTAGLALAAAVVLTGATVLARRDATDALAGVIRQVVADAPTPPATVPEIRAWESYNQVSDFFHYGYGFGIAVAALAVVGVGNAVAAARRPAREGASAPEPPPLEPPTPEPTPEPPTPEPPTPEPPTP